MTTEIQSTLGPALGQVSSGLFVLTVRKGTEQAAMLASWVQQAAFSPPAVTIAVGKDRPLAQLLAEGDGLVVNVLPKGQGKLVGHFARGFDPGTNPFAGIEVGETAGQQPYLQESLSYLDCVLKTRLDAGDHWVLLAEVRGGAKLGEGEPATHTRKDGFRY
ncbi:flavin reductase family protein [Leptolyngbya sp. FACHB-261]|uniref:flavin reductase family protein n=1 Tax=Leptolyngbya sp. FACHB-261 TaxID=2692806 RepID=UPI0016869686|nr:flavin reductase family protein [Leptolyngbya sp. FACHB-261]MBD2104074.1 flavin reductase [Leptolyngbya sp. FACHB-261]